MKELAEETLGIIPKGYEAENASYIKVVLQYHSSLEKEVIIEKGILSLRNFPIPAIYKSDKVIDALMAEIGKIL